MIDIRKDFPNLEEKNRGKTLVYLDSAATSLTPKQVINSESEYYDANKLLSAKFSNWF